MNGYRLTAKHKSYDTKLVTSKHVLRLSLLAAAARMDVSQVFAQEHAETPLESPSPKDFAKVCRVNGEVENGSTMFLGNLIVGLSDQGKALNLSVLNEIGVQIVSKPAGAGRYELSIQRASDDRKGNEAPRTMPWPPNTPHQFFAGNLKIHESIVLVSLELADCKELDVSSLTRSGYSLADAPDKKLEWIVERHKETRTPELDSLFDLVSSVEPNSEVRLAASRAARTTTESQSKDSKHDMRQEYFDMPLDQQDPLVVEAQKSVVMILTSDGKPLCTGAFVSPTTILTAAHCIKDFSTDSKVEVRQYSSRSSFKSYTASLKYLAHNNGLQDSAVLELQDGNKADHFVPMRPLVEGKEHFYIGHPNRGGGLHPLIGSQKYQKIMHTNFESYSSYQDRIDGSRQLPNKNNGNDELSNTIVSMSAWVAPGNSGGPLFQINRDQSPHKVELAGILTGAYYPESPKSLTVRGLSSQHIWQSIHSGGNSELAVRLNSQHSPVNNNAVFRADQRIQTLEPLRYLSESVAFRDITISEQDIGDFVAKTKCSFENVRFVGIAIYHADFSNCKFRNVTFEGVVFSDQVKWPKGFQPTPKNNLGPLRLQGDTSNKRLSTNFSERDLSNIIVPHGFVLEDANFRGANLEGATFMASFRGTTNFSNANLSRTLFYQLMFEDHSLNDSDKLILRGAKIQDVGIGVQISGGLAEPARQQIKDLTTPTPEKSAETTIEFSGELGTENRFSSAVTHIKKMVSKWGKLYPKLFRSLSNTPIVFSASSGIANGETSHIEIDRSRKPARLIRVELHERLLEDPTNNFDQLERTLFHELVHVASRTTPISDLRGPRYEELRESSSELHALVKTTFSRYLKLKESGQYAQAKEYSRNFANQYGYPSLYSMVHDNGGSQQSEVTAEFLAAAALEPSFATWASPQMQTQVHAILKP